MKKLCLIFGICCVASSGCFGKDAYHFLSEIPIGGEGGWDILTIDPTANRLYLSHATKVVVVDLGKNCSDRRNHRHARSSRVCCCAGIAARILFKWKRGQSERRRSKDIKNDFKNRYRTPIRTRSFTNQIAVNFMYSIIPEIRAP